MLALSILNYCNFKDTVACLNSVLSLNTLPNVIIVVDNNSPDNSYAELAEWGSKKLDSFFKVDSEELSLGLKDEVLDNLGANKTPTLILIKSDKNGGYAYGNNKAIYLALELGVNFVWVLNNDTVLEPGSLEAMRKKFQTNNQYGLCGSTVRYQSNGLVQCCGGGKTNYWTGLSKLNGHLKEFEGIKNIDEDKIEEEINFIYGASVMVSRDFLENVGLMDDIFFLYCEEQDWSLRAKGRYKLGYAKEAIVWHKEGASTGWNKSKGNLRSIYHLTRSRTLLTYKHYPLRLPTVLATILFAGARLFLKRLMSTFSRSKNGYGGQV